ncbi:hypothetical protein BLGI_4158 [Brevibacillus laterosporus GI-9]|nr:hypothetical protein BLGI_4158 [Brevibacillus laterosporus GI-9]
MCMNASQFTDGGFHALPTFAKKERAFFCTNAVITYVSAFSPA